MSKQVRARHRRRRRAAAVSKHALPDGDVRLIRGRARSVEGAARIRVLRMVADFEFAAEGVERAYLGANGVGRGKRAPAAPPLVFTQVANRQIAAEGVERADLDARGLDGGCKHLGHVGCTRVWALVWTGVCKDKAVHIGVGKV